MIRRKFTYLLSILFVVCFSFLSSVSVFAANLQLWSFDLHYSIHYGNCRNYQWSSDLRYNQNTNVCNIVNYRVTTYDVQSSGEYWTVSGKVNLVARSRYGEMSEGHFTNLDQVSVINASIGNNFLTISNQQIQTYVTDWSSGDASFQTLTIIFSVGGSGSSNLNGKIGLLVGSNNYNLPIWGNVNNSYDSPAYFEDTGEYFQASFTDYSSEATGKTIIDQNQTVIRQNDRTNELLENMYNQEQGDRQSIQGRSADIDTAGANSQQSAENTGTTLLQAFTAFVGALTSATPSNCNLDMDLGNLDMGVVNLCSLSPPAGFSALASIFLILFCVPLSIATARKVITLFRSFQS